jgi:hypothetical protein
MTISVAVLWGATARWNQTQPAAAIAPDTSSTNKKKAKRNLFKTVIVKLKIVDSVITYEAKSLLW